MSHTPSIGIIFKGGFDIAKKEAEKLRSYLIQKGIQVFMEEMTSSVGNYGSIEQKSSIPDSVKWVVVLGGDGTLLGAARRIGSLGVSIMGVNLGGLGFLTSIPLSRLYQVIDRLIKDELEIERRIMLDIEVLRGKERVCQFSVLNDVVINKGPLARILDLDVFISDEFLTTFRADGLIVSTPTGSTAYNLAAGGPIIHPTMSNFILTPICPFTLTNRPIILPETETIIIRMKSKSSEKVSLTFDGQVGFDLSHEDRVLIKKSDKMISLVKSPDKSYFEILRTKLMWGGITYNKKDEKP